MDDFINQLQNYSDNLVPNIEHQQRITQAGAKVLEKNLQEVTPVSKLNRKKDKHLKEYVMSQNTNIDGQEDGSSTVGFGKKAYIARFLNDGTVKMSDTHFVDNAVNESKKEVLLANKAEYDKIMRGGK